VSIEFNQRESSPLQLELKGGRCYCSINVHVLSGSSGKKFEWKGNEGFETTVHLSSKRKVVSKLPVTLALKPWGRKGTLASEVLELSSLLNTASGDNKSQAISSILFNPPSDPKSRTKRYGSEEGAGSSAEVVEGRMDESKQDKEVKDDIGESKGRSRRGSVNRHRRAKALGGAHSRTVTIRMKDTRGGYLSVGLQLTALILDNQKTEASAADRSVLSKVVSRVQTTRVACLFSLTLKSLNLPNRPLSHTSNVFIEWQRGSHAQRSVASTWDKVEKLNVWDGSEGVLTTTATLYRHNQTGIFQSKPSFIIARDCKNNAILASTVIDLANMVVYEALDLILPVDDKVDHGLLTLSLTSSADRSATDRIVTSIKGKKKAFSSFSPTLAGNQNSISNEVLLQALEAK